MIKAPTTGNRPLTPTLDVHDLLIRLGGDASLAAECAEIFCDDAATRLLAVDEHLGQGELEAVAQQCHSLKGGAGTAGARAFEQLAATTERAALQGDESEVTGLIGDMQLELGRLRTAVARLRVTG